MKSIPPLRSDLVVKKQTVSQIIVYIIKDPVKQAYFRFEEEEYFVLSRLDGKKTPGDLATVYNEQFQDDLEPSDILEFISSVRYSDLLERSPIEQNIFYYEQLKEQRKSIIRQAKGSALYFRIPVVDPDAFFNRLIPYIRWLWSPLSVILCVLFILSAVAVLTTNYTHFKIGLAQTFDIFNQDAASLLLLWATIMIVVVIHETGHGLTCKRYSGECREIGFLFMFFTPCMYANVNDAWMFENKRHRLYVTFAGCYIELLVGSIAVYVWLLTQQGALINLLAFKVIVVCFFSAIFMNFNPLMKFDGYFALSDFVEIPNLRTRSREYLSYLIQTNFFRLRKEFEVLTKREQWILGVYGFLSAIYMFNVMLGIVLLAGGTIIKYFHAAGVLMTAGIGYKFFGHSIRKLINFVRLIMTEHKKFFSRAIVRIVGLSGLTTAVLVSLFFPFPYHLKAAASLKPVREVVVRALESGYVNTLNSHKNEFNKGETLIQQHNHELLKQRKNFIVDIEANELLQQVAVAKGGSAELAKLKKLRQKLEEELKETNRQYQNLIVQAPFSGVLVDKLDAFEHTLVGQGDELGRFIDPTMYLATLSVHERDLEGIQKGTPASLMVEAQPEILFNGEVTQIAPLHETNGIDRLYNVTIAFPNKELILRSGLEGTVFLNIGNVTLPKRFIRWFKKTIRLDLQM